MNMWRMTSRGGRHRLLILGGLLTLGACDAAPSTNSSGGRGSGEATAGPDAERSPDAAVEHRDGDLRPDLRTAVDVALAVDAATLDGSTPPADATPGPSPDLGGPCESDLDVFVRTVAPLLSADDPQTPACKMCHAPGGIASPTRLVFAALDASPAADLSTIERFLASGPEAPTLLVDKPTQRVPHGGGRRLMPGSADERAFLGLVERWRTPDAACPVPLPDAGPPQDAAPDLSPPPPPADAAPDLSMPVDAALPGDCTTDQEFLIERFAPLVDTQDARRPACMLCHTANGPGGGTRLVFEPFAAPEAAARNYAMLEALVAAPGGARLLIEKPTATVPHGGGRRFPPDGATADVFREMIERLTSPADACAGPSADAGVPLPPEPPPVDRCRLAGPHTASGPLRRLTDTQYAGTIERVLGVDVPMADRPPSPAFDAFHTFATNNVVSAPGVESLQFAAERAAATVDLAGRLDCDPGESEAACAGRFLVVHATLLFRRPLTPDETAHVLALAQTGLPLVDTVRFGLEVLLQSPQFLYLDPDAGDLLPGESRPASPATIAARIAYFLTNAPPDEGLRLQAATGRLTTRDEVHAAAAELLDRPGVSEVVARFHRDWLHLGLLDQVAKDPARHPDWNQSLVEQARTEVDLFTTEVFWQGDARFSTLLRDTRSWLTPALGAVYGIPVAGPGYSRVDLGPDRPGVLTRVAFLAAHAYASTSSPVRRGAFVLKQMLCESLSPPPGVNMALPEGPEAAQTVRERLVQHWTDAQCATCHLRIDPIGLAFEHFGAVGERRSVYPNGEEVAAAGIVDDPALAFDDATGLIDGLVDEPRVRACYVRRWYEFAVGRRADEADACTLEVLGARFDASGGDVRALLADIASTDAFLFSTAVDAAEVQP
jgi:hypothetical protein